MPYINQSKKSFPELLFSFACMLRVLMFLEKADMTKKLFVIEFFSSFLFDLPPDEGRVRPGTGEDVDVVEEEADAADGVAGDLGLAELGLGGRARIPEGAKQIERLCT